MLPASVQYDLKAVGVEIWYTKNVAHEEIA